MIFINDTDLKCDTCFNYLYVVVHSSLFAIYNYTGCLSPSDSEKAEQPPENSLSSEQVSLLLQKVFTKDRLKAILLQEGEEDQTKVQNLQQDLEGKEWYQCVCTNNGYLHVYIDMNVVPFMSSSNIAKLKYWSNVLSRVGQYYIIIYRDIKVS